MGILYTTVGKAGFITAMYIVLVPLFGIFIGRKLKLRIWLSVLAAAIGLYLLCMGAGEGLSAGKGEALCLACAVLFAVQILLIDHFAPEDGVLFSTLQFAVSCVFSSVLMLLFEHPSLELLLQAAGPILYAGILSCGVGYTLQVIGQKGMNPTIASLIMSLESTISAIAGFFLLHQSLSGREIWGCCIMGLAIVLAQL
jgi:drug/metabolite transporter (DMT)-like permease